MIGRFEENTIYNEDFYKAIKEIPDKSIDCIYIDIPYEYTTGGGSSLDLGKRYAKRECELLGLNERLKEKFSKDMQLNRDHIKRRMDLTSMENGIDYAILPELVRVMKKINIFIWCSKQQFRYLENYFEGEKGCYKELLVWAKTNTMPTGKTWASDLEYCFHFREEGVALNNGANLKHKFYVSATNRADKTKYGHPTIKPLSFVTQHILHATQPNDIVLDGFIGSGTTAVSCINTGRRYLGFEIDPYKYKVAVDRTKQIDANGQMSMFAM